MLTLENYKNVFAAVGLVGVLLIASPTLGWFVHLPGGEKFSELWILGPGHMADGYPFNVAGNVNYLIYVGVGNHMGSSTYYAVYAKFRNQTDSLPNATSGVPSSLGQLYECKVFLQDGQEWSAPLTFSFSNVSSLEDKLAVGSLTINGATYSVNKPSSWDAKYNGFYYQLFIELWIYDAQNDLLRFHDRFVSLWLNVTAPQ